MTTPHGDGVVVNADERDGWLVYTVLIGCRYVEVDEDDVDVRLVTVEGRYVAVDDATAPERRKARPHPFAGVE